MARTQKSYTIVFTDLDAGKAVSLHYANVDALKDAIKKHTGKEILVFEGKAVEFEIDATPRITIGGKKERKPRTKKAAKAKNGSTGPVVPAIEHQHKA